MSRIILVRHAQATFSADPAEAFENYDQLSALGLTQADALGEELVRSRVVFDRVFVGPARRHEQTADGVASAYSRGGLPWPNPSTIQELQEHSGASVVEIMLSRPQYEDARKQIQAPGADSRTRARAYFSAFREITRSWARAELTSDWGGDPSAGLGAVESWQAFRARVQRGVGRILEEASGSATIAVFTSGGPIGSIVARVLGLDDEQAIELAWAVQNTTATELVFREDRLSLKSFNAQPRFSSVELVTYV
jgi:broad specificity phosphatase PhoE